MRWIGASFAVAAAGMLVAATPPAALLDSPEARARYQTMADTAGTGPFPAIKTVDPAFPGYVVYRPRDLTRLNGVTLPVVAWGNGGCSADGASARLELLEIASHGYLVLAPGTVRSGPGALPHAPDALPKGGPLPSETKPEALVQAIDLAIRAASDGPYAHVIDGSRIAVAGHSCGGLQAIAAAADPRVRTAVIQNSGTFPDGQHPIIGVDVPKTALNALHTPVIYLLGGQTDIAHNNGMDDFTRIQQVPVVVANSDVGHSGSFYQPNGGDVTQVALAWLNWQLRGDKHAEAMFVGPQCGLCVRPGWTVQRKGL